MSEPLENGDVSICFMTPNANGRIASRSLQGRSPVTQYACACDITQGLPLPSNPHQHALTVDATVVNCPACQKTPEFLERYQSQTGHPFPGSVTTTAAPVLEPPVVVDAPVETP